MKSRTPIELGPCEGTAVMEYEGYVAEAVEDSETGIYSGIVSNISDTIHFESESLQDLEKAFRESVEEYRAFLEEEGKFRKRRRDLSLNSGWMAASTGVLCKSLTLKVRP